MSAKQIDLARKDPDKKVVNDDHDRCCGEMVVVTYYDSLAPDRTCSKCGRTW